MQTSLLQKLIKFSIGFIILAIIFQYFSFLSKEDKLVQNIKQLIIDPKFSKLNDFDLRSKIQALARKENINLQFENIILNISDQVYPLKGCTSIGFIIPYEIKIINSFKIPLIFYKLIPVPTVNQET